MLRSLVFFILPRPFAGTDKNPLPRGATGGCVSTFPFCFLYSTVTDLARFLGLSTSQPRVRAA